MSYYTVKQMAMRYPAFTEAALWDYIFHRETNGFHACTSKIENKRIIYDAEFQIWVKEYNKNNSNTIQQSSGIKNKTQWEKDLDVIINASSKDFMPAKFIHDEMMLDWYCEKGHVFPYAYGEMKSKGISCPNC